MLSIDALPGGVPWSMEVRQVPAQKKKHTEYQNQSKNDLKKRIENEAMGFSQQNLFPYGKTSGKNTSNIPSHRIPALIIPSADVYVLGIPPVIRGAQG